MFLLCMSVMFKVKGKTGGLLILVLKKIYSSSNFFCLEMGKKKNEQKQITLFLLSVSSVVMMSSVSSGEIR